MDLSVRTVVNNTVVNTVVTALISSKSYPTDVTLTAMNSRYRVAVLSYYRLRIKILCCRPETCMNEYIVLILEKLTMALTYWCFESFVIYLLRNEMITIMAIYGCMPCC